MGRIFGFALTAALNPTLLTATTVMLLLDRPKRLMLGYWLGAMTTGIVVGTSIVLWMGSSGVSTSQHQVAPGVDFAIGVILLLASVLMGAALYTVNRSVAPYFEPGHSGTVQAIALIALVAAGTFVYAAAAQITGAMRYSMLRRAFSSA